MAQRDRGGKRGLGVWLPIIAILAIALMLFSNLMNGGDSPSSATSVDADLRIVSGSENKALEPIIQKWAEDNSLAVEVSYLGSVDISREVAKGAGGGYDAVWPANSLWIALGDEQRRVKHSESILRSPVVLGVKRSIAERLGWVGRDDVTIQDIQAAAAEGAFRLAMTSATQSNSGASAYFGFLYALAGDPDVLTLDHLEDESVREKVRGLLGAVDKSSGSSGWLKDAFAANPDRFDAMMNYEALVIEANRAFASAGRETLYLVYPANGLAVADSPLGYVDKGDAAKEQAFLALQKHLLSPEVQDQLIALGRRAGLIGLDVAQADQAVWNPAWGVDLSRSIAPIPTPKADVIRRALTLYQTDLRKPSLTIWVLDVSGSMEGGPIEALKQAMALLLDPESAAINLLQPSARDVTVVIPFNNSVQGVWRVEGDAADGLSGMLTKVRRLQAGGGTDVYGALIKAIEVLERQETVGDLFEYLPAIVAMTDGDSDTENLNAFQRRLADASFGRDVPIHAIAFGNANEKQLTDLTDATVGRLFHARADLAGALRKAKGYN